MRIRKLKKNNVRNTNKTRQLKQEVLELSSTGIHTEVQRRDWEEKKFCGNKTKYRLLNMWIFDISFSRR